MPSIGKASLTIVPKFDNLGRSVTAALDGVDATSSGVRIGTTVSSGIAQGTGGLVKSGALMGVFSAATTKAMEMIGSSVGGAVSRLDTLNNYHRVMQALGYSAEASEASVAKMADRLTGLPTALDDMTSTVQGISAITGDLDQATDAGLALNDMLLSSGSSTAIASAAMEQFRQMLAKGKPEMQDWKSLTSAMPGQMSQLAKAMLGPTANANDLYAALGGGGGDAVVTMDQLMSKMVELDTVGGDGVTSFAEQARNATGGIETSMANMQTAIARGMADVLDSIGTDNVKQAAGDVGKGMENGLKLVGDGVSAAMPLVKGFYGAVKEIAPATVPAIASIGALALAYKGVNGAAAIATNGIGAMAGLKGVATGASDAFLTLATRAKEGGVAQKGLLSVSSVLGGTMGGPLVAGAGIAAAAIGILGVAIYDSHKKAETMKRGTDGLRDAMDKAASPIKSVSSAFDDITSSSAPAAKSLREVKKAAEDAAAAGAELAQTISGRADETARSTGLLEAYKETIEELNGKYDENGAKAQLSASEQARLQYAIEQVNAQCGTQYSVIDKVNGVIADQNGVVQANTDEINENVEARQQQLLADMYAADFADAYKGQLDALNELNEAKARLREEDAKLREVTDAGLSGDALDPYIRNVESAQDAVDDLTGLFESSKDAADKAAQGMQGVSSGAADLSLYLQGLMSDSTEAGAAIGDALDAMGEDSSTLSQRLVDAGVSAEAFSDISQDEFRDMAESCGGDVDALIQKILEYAGTDLGDKHATAEVTGGAVDGTDKAALEDTGRAQDGIDDKSVSVDVSGNYESASGKLWSLAGAIANIGSQRINAFFGLNAAGGIRLNADGGYRMHAGGAIATRAVPLDVVGEDGAEAIVPLTNKRYSEPFARTLAEQIGEHGGGTNTYYSYVIDGIEYSGDEVVERKISELVDAIIQRKGAM